MATNSAHRWHQWQLALLAAVATVLGGLIAGFASYFATREANRAVLERDQRNERLDARSAARLVDSELSDIGAILRSLREGDLGAARLASELKQLPTTAWTANQQRLARGLGSGDWQTVSRAYALGGLLPSSLSDSARVLTRGSPGDEASRVRRVKTQQMGFVLKNVGWAQRDLRRYQ